MQSHLLHRTRFGQYQTLSAVLGLPGDGDCYLMHKMQSGGWPYKSQKHRFFMQLFFVQLSFVPRSCVAIVIVDHHVLSVCKHVHTHGHTEACTGGTRSANLSKA